MSEEKYAIIDKVRTDCVEVAMEKEERAFYFHKCFPFFVGCFVIPIYILHMLFPVVAFRCRVF